MIKRFQFLLSTLIILTLTVSAQDINKTVAKAGDMKISQREFKLRYELVPHYSRDESNEDSSKHDLIYSLIAEKLLAQEAERLGYDTLSYYKNSVEQMKDLYVRDALYRKEVDSKVNITSGEIQKALDRYSQSLQVRIISAPDSEQIFQYYGELKNGASFDSIEQISDPVEYDSNKTPIKITYGQMQDDYVEDTLYSLKVGHFSSPVRTRGGWFIFKLVGVINRIPPNAKDPDYDKSIMQVLRLRKSRVIGLKYLNNFYKSKEATVDSVLFLKLAGKISSILTDKMKHHNFGTGNMLFLDEGNIMSIIRDFGSEIVNEDIVHIKKHPIKLKEYLYSLVEYPLLIKEPSLRYTAYALMDNLNKYIQYKFLAEEGLKQNLQNSPELKEDLSIWKDDYLAKMLKNSIRDSVHVTDSEVKDSYLTNNESEQVDILEILNSNLEVIENVFKGLEAGADFRSLASRYTQRSWTKDRGGEFGYFPVNSFGEIGKAAARMKLNQVYGPIKTDSGYSVIKLIGRRFEKTKSDENFDSLKTQLRYSLLEKKFNEKFNKYIAGLAEKYKFSVNERLLKDTKVLDIPMFTYKFIGFGGRIAAMPFLGSWYNWVNYLGNKSNIVP